MKVAGNISEVVELYIKIPKRKEYYNKKYQAIIEVKNKKNRPEEVFVLACQLKMLFSTIAGEEKEKSGSEVPETEGCAECGGKTE